MSTYRIKSGDTLSHLALKFRTSVSALAKANGIKNPDLIYAGASLKIPGGGGDSYSAPSKGKVDLQGGPKTQGPKVDGPNPNAPAGKGGSAFEIAKQYLGRNAGDIKYGKDAVGKAMQDWVPNNVNCANFVSATLIASGQLPANQGSAGVIDLMGKLDRNGYSRISLKDAKPGDVVSMKTNGGQHVVLFAGWENGKAKFIGSNNVNADGSQRVSYTTMNYPIMAVHRYNG
jgi:hypothetical protein